MYTKLDEKELSDVLLRLFNGSIKETRLDIGSGGKNVDYITIDKHNDADITGDIRCCFAPVYRDSYKKYKQLKNIKNGYYAFIRLSHVVEHIEWIYQQWMMDWVYSITRDGGWVYIATPNLSWIVDQYILKDDTLVLEHPDLTGEPADFVKWMNFKLYSGASTNRFVKGCTDGDFHLCMYDAELMNEILSRSGFVDIHIAETETLSCIARRGVI